ncbi:MAG: orotidine-5'-phosphate decarboxylase [Hydrogenibacillus schlegelii]|uniref:Orotidine 5'-phosphate decarboxylase n=1 Tax=Hydrogenibacillus schlegelii TaxID=1484 RepID=A0A947CZS0_HYDSH|nr:orotidine-5'-phosphate decarboxylase [Hydrogenibacillus schlegelii]
MTAGKDAAPPAADRIVVALDVAPDALAPLLRALEGEARWYKVGLSLFYAAHREAIAAVRAAGGNVFLDLKLHDIPSTVARTVAALADLGAAWLTVHALGGPKMLAAAQKAAEGGPKLLAVTVLTHHDPSELRRLGLDAEPGRAALRLAGVAAEAGLFGVVAAPEEAAAIKAAYPSLFVVTPGIRWSGAPAAGDDQARILDPAAAIRAGSDALVVGRPIYGSADPRAAFLAVRDAVAGALRPAAADRPGPNSPVGSTDAGRDAFLSRGPGQTNGPGPESRREGR